MATQTQSKTDMTGETIYQSGAQVIESGEYEIIDAQGNRTDFDIVTLDEGETFPNVAEEGLSFRMLATCVDENCDINVADADGDAE